MNFSIIRKTLGALLIFEAIFFVVPAVTAIFYQEWTELLVFGICMGICGGVGGLCSLKSQKGAKCTPKKALRLWRFRGF